MAKENFWDQDNGTLSLLPSLICSVALQDLSLFAHEYDCESSLLLRPHSISWSLKSQSPTHTVAFADIPMTVVKKKGKKNIFMIHRNSAFAGPPPAILPHSGKTYKFKFIEPSFNAL